MRAERAKANRRLAVIVVWMTPMIAALWVALTRYASHRPWTFVIAVGAPVTLGRAVSTWHRQRR